MKPILVYSEIYEHNVYLIMLTSAKLYTFYYKQHTKGAMTPRFSAAINSHENLASTLGIVQILRRANTARRVFSF